MSLPNTRVGASGIAAALTGKKKLFFIGIGGVHMAPMAERAMEMGYEVSGSDRIRSPAVARLAALGIPVYHGHDAARVVGADAVIYTLAVSAENPEYTAARRLGIPTFSRADFLSFLTAAYSCRIGVSGSHGKSTVTAMLAHILLAAGRAPAVFCGAPLREGTSGLLSGGGDYAVLEACEYQDSFLCLAPTLALLLNVEQDHVDYFPDRQALERSFSAFAALPGAGGRVLYNAEDEACVRCIEKSPAACFSFGVERGDFHTRLRGYDRGCADFVPVLPSGEAGERITLRVVGRHNVCNAIAAYGAAVLCGVEGACISRALSGFRGAGRRMEYRGLLRGAVVYDDYAHHPTEVRAALAAARQLAGEGRLLAVFQSHTYSRTAAFFGELCDALRGADRVLIPPIYAARERDTLGMSAEGLAAGVGEQALPVPDLATAAAILERAVAPGDLVLIMGAGDVDGIFSNFSGKHFTLR